MSNPKISPVTGHYVTIDVDGLEYKVFYLENGTGQPLVCALMSGSFLRERRVWLPIPHWGRRRLSHETAVTSPGSNTASSSIDRRHLLVLAAPRG